MKHTFNGRSFFTSDETLSLGGGLEVWRGYFQSVRPGIGRMFINVDISTALMFKPGPLISICLEVLGKSDLAALDPRRNFGERDRLMLQRFLAGARVLIKPAASGSSTARVSRTIKKITAAPANGLTFTTSDGRNLTVADYYRSQQHILTYPGLPCIEVC